MENESQEEIQEQPDAVEEAKQILEQIKQEKAELSAVVEARNKQLARDVLSGKSYLSERPREETAKEYAERVMRNEI